MDNTRVTVAVAAQELNLPKLTVQYMMKNNLKPVCDIGFAIKNEGSHKYTFYIYREKLNSIKRLLGLSE